MRLSIISARSHDVATYTNVIDPSLVYDKFPEIISSLNVFSLLLCFYLLIKGYYFPSTTDSGTNGSLIFDYYWGVDLYPKILT